MPMTFLFEQLVRTGFSELHIDEGMEFYTKNDLKISNQGQFILKKGNPTSCMYAMVGLKDYFELSA